VGLHCFPLYAAHLRKKVATKSVPSQFTVSTVKGGLTNQLYKCCVGDEIVLVRVYGKQTEEVIDRMRENVVVDVFSQIGFGPRIFGRFPAGRVEQYFQAHALTPADMSKDELVPHIAQRVGQMHVLDMRSLEPRLPCEITVFTTLAQWLQKAIAIRFDDKSSSRKAEQLRGLKLDEIALEFATVRNLLAQGGDASQALVFAHNDLLSGNILWDAKGKVLRLIDYEYSGYNPRAFDIANHFCECCGFDCDWKMFPSRAQQSVFFRHYLSETTRKPASGIADTELDQLYEEVNAWVPVSHLFWGVWAVVQSRASLIDFDYLNYASLRFHGYYLHKSKLKYAEK